MLGKNTPYFLQTENGESRWWSWLIGFWFILFGWIVAQNVIFGPAPIVVAESHPEIADAFNQASFDLIDDIGQEKFLATAGLTLMFTLFTIIGWIVNRNSRDTVRHVFGWITGISAALSVYFGGKFIVLGSSEKISSALNKMLEVSPVAYGLMLASFPGTLVGVYLVQKFINKRTITSLHTAASKIDWMRILYAIGLTVGVFGLVTFITHITGISTVKATFDPSRFWYFAIATILFIPLQSATEEIIFRGYLNQGFGHFISNKWIVFAITSAAFASMHLANPEAQSGAEQGGLMHLIVMSHYFLFGFILSVMVYFEDGLEAAIGVHAGNNLFAAMFVNYEGSVLPTPSLYLASPNPNLDIPIGVGTLALIAWILYKTRKNRAQAA